MKRYPISISIGAGLILALMLTSPAFAEFLVFKGWAIEKDGHDTTGYTACNFIALSPDNKHAYTPHYNRKVLVFNRDATTGKLNFVESQMDGVNNIECLSSVFAIRVSSDGKHVYMVSLHDNSLVVFSRDMTFGRLTFVECKKANIDGVKGIVSPMTLVLSPDDKSVYAAGYDSNAVAVFSRDVTTGRLTFVEAQKKGINGIEGLAGVTSVTITPDGKNLYAASAQDSTLTIFGRDAATGKLTLVETQKNGMRGVDGLAGAQCVIASQDGKNIYVAGFIDDAIAVFGRDPAFGKLTFLEMHKNGLHGIQGIGGVVALSLSPNRKYVYAISQTDQALTVFSRHEQTGRLTFMEMYKSGINGVHGLLAPQHLTISADGKHIYVLSRSRSTEKPILFSVPIE